jgi:hypothetical protein
MITGRRQIREKDVERELLSSKRENKRRFHAWGGGHTWGKYKRTKQPKCPPSLSLTAIWPVKDFLRFLLMAEMSLRRLE